MAILTLTDEHGKPVAVQIPIDEWEQLQEERRLLLSTAADEPEYTPEAAAYINRRLEAAHQRYLNGEFVSNDEVLKMVEEEIYGV